MKIFNKNKIRKQQNHNITDLNYVINYTYKQIIENKSS